MKLLHRDITEKIIEATEIEVASLLILESFQNLNVKYLRTKIEKINLRKSPQSALSAFYFKRVPLAA